MATNATIAIKEKGKTLCNLYVHWDGYWDGLGKDIVNIISKGKLQNGLGGDRTLGLQFNGGGCLAATLITKLKTEPGNVYLTDNNTENESNHYDLKINGYGIELYHNKELKWDSLNSQSQVIKSFILYLNKLKNK